MNFRKFYYLLIFSLTLTSFHFQLLSTFQFVHPSLLILFQSSHSSPDTFILSPHIGVHTLPHDVVFNTHLYPGRVPDQSAVHPTPSLAFPSSHVSDEVTNPSPHFFQSMCQVDLNFLHFNAIHLLFQYNH